MERNLFILGVLRLLLTIYALGAWCVNLYQLGSIIFDDGKGNIVVKLIGFISLIGASITVWIN